MRSKIGLSGAGRGCLDAEKDWLFGSVGDMQVRECVGVCE